VETRHWRNVRTAQGSVAGNTCPPRGEDQSNRDESQRATAAGETGNLYAQQYQVGERGGRGSRRGHPSGAPGSSRVGSTELVGDNQPRGMAVTSGQPDVTESGLPADFTLLFWCVQHPSTRPSFRLRARSAVSGWLLRRLAQPASRAAGAWLR